MQIFAEPAKPQHDRFDAGLRSRPAGAAGSVDPRTDGRSTGSRIHPTPVARGALRRVEPMQLCVSVSLCGCIPVRGLSGSCETPESVVRNKQSRLVSRRISGRSLSSCASCPSCLRDTGSEDLTEWSAKHFILDKSRRGFYLLSLFETISGSERRAPIVGSSDG